MVKRSVLTLLACLALVTACTTTQQQLPEIEIIPGINAPISSQQPSTDQLKQIKRQYGMFIHFGINTFHDQEWTDGSKPASSYQPKTIDAKQWVSTAKKAGMKYIILVTKHHEGFCLWDSPLTDYDIGSSANQTDVVEAVAKECREQGIELGLYYSLWDRKMNGKVRRVKEDAAYNQYMLKQIEHIMSSYGDICELWLDGGWVKENYRWPTFEIYELVKRLQPSCQIGINWSIGLPEDPDYHAVYPKDQKEGYPIRYFPADFRLGDPYLPVENDPKTFSHKDQSYYMPWESTLCLSERWFYNTTDKGPKPVDEMIDIFKQATTNDNILIINCAPGPDGKLREKDVQRLVELRSALEKENILK